METDLFLSDTYYKQNEISLKLRPLEKLGQRKDGQKACQALNTDVRYFEIQHPVPQASILDVIYPLVQNYVTKAKIYVVDATSTSMTRLLVETPVLTQNLWDRFKAYFIPNQSQQDNEKDCLDQYEIKEDEDCVIIEAIENRKICQPVVNKEEENESISSSMAESTFTTIDHGNFRSKILLKRMDVPLEESVGFDFCQSLNDGKYRNSFNISDRSSINYAPEVTLESFDAANCRAAEFELVGNKIFVRDVENKGMPEIMEQLETESDQSFQAGA